MTQLLLKPHGSFDQTQNLEKVYCIMYNISKSPQISLCSLSFRCLTKPKVFNSSSPAASQSTLLSVQALKKYINLLCKCCGNMSNGPCSDMYTKKTVIPDGVKAILLFLFAREIVCSPEGEHNCSDCCKLSQKRFHQRVTFH